jgi:hypothetical protein
MAQLYWWEAATGQWQALATTGDAEQGKATTMITHLGIYMPLASQQQQLFNIYIHR